MTRFIITASILFIACVAHAQNFPDAQKQPRQKEMHRQHRRFKRQAHRRHVRRGTAYNRFDNTPLMPFPIYIITDERKQLMA